MDVDPKTTSASDVAGNRGEYDKSLPPTENISGRLLNDRYLLGPELGRGGFAITYLAADLGVASRKVVVKVLNEYRSSDAWSLKKFKSEMEALARIDHPNVVTVFDYGCQPDGKPFLVMQYLPGRSLRKMLLRTGLPLGQVAQIMKQIGRALSAAHEVGVCHRDLKPENIIVQSERQGEEQVRLIDFGIASIRAAGEESSSTSASGTYVYMAPEQFHGKSTFESDIYQMGVVAYELVTGITPFRGATPAGIVMEHMDGLKVLPRDLRPDVPEAAQELILKALAADPADRFERARDFGDALAAALVSNIPTTSNSIKSLLERTATTKRGEIALKRRNRPWASPLAWIAILAALSAAAYFVFRARWSGGADSVAVLPFQNRTGDPQMAYLADGVTESLIDDLSRIPTLRVSGRGSVLKYDSSRVDVQAAGRNLGVSRVVDGFITRQGDTFSLDAELIDVRSGIRLWGNAYSERVSSLADVLQQFSTEVTDQLRLKLSPPLKDRLKRQYPKGSQAYQQYLQGRFYLNKRTATGFEEAIRYFNQAIGADPEYAAAYSGLADTYGFIAVFRSAYGGMIPAEALQESRKAARHALELDGTLAEAYAAQAFVEMQADYNWAAAEQDFRRAIQLDPNWPNAHELYAFELSATGRFDGAIREIEEAERLAPDVIGIKAAHGLVLRMARRYDESLVVLKGAIHDSQSRGIFADTIAEDYWAKSMPNEALSIVEAVPPSLTPHFRIPLLVAAYARAGQTARAQQLLSSYTVQSETTWWYGLAVAHLSLNQTQDALNDLQHGYEQRYQEVIWLAVDPLLDELQNDPRFHILLSRIKRDVK